MRADSSARREYARVVHRHVGVDRFIAHPAPPAVALGHCRSVDRRAHTAGRRGENWETILKMGASNAHPDQP
jgi:hypothetical protein